MRVHLASLVNDFRSHGEQTAIVLHRGNRSYRTSYRGVAELSGRFAAELERRGVAPGERVVLWGENSAEWVASFFGCLLRGVVAVPLDAGGSSEFAARVIVDTSPKLIVGDAALLHGLGETIPQLSFSDLRSQLPEHPLFEVQPDITADTPFQIIFTSGTTSEPKGIVHTHRNVLASLSPIEGETAKYRMVERLVHPLRFLHTLPLSHVFGQFMGLYIPSLLAAEVHFDAQLEPARIVEEIRRERISVLVAVPRVLHLLRAHLLGRFPEIAGELEAAQGRSAWRRWWRFRRVHRAFGFKFWAFLCGGASLAADLERFWSTLGFALIQGYGMTETAALITLNHPFRVSRGTIGKALPGREVRLENGEILVRGDMLSTATWQNGGMKPREAEWLATGDLAERDEAGDLRFVGRKGDVIVTASGMNIHPGDLEQALASQPGVRGCVVVSCETMAGAEPVAVALFAGSDSELQVAVRRANERLATFQQIRRTFRWPELAFPYTSTGKLLRRKVADWACAALAGRQQAQGEMRGGERDTLLEMIASITGEAIEHGGEDSRLSEDLHLDSLGRVQLQSAIEQKLGVEVSDDAVAGVETLGKLRRLVEHVPGDRVLSQMEHDRGQDFSGQQARPDASPDKPDETPTSTGSEHSYPHWPWTMPVRILRVLFLELLMRPLIRLLAAPKVIWDFAALPAGPFLLIANHVTAYDGALILYALPARLRQHVAVAMSGEMLQRFREGRNQGTWWKNALAPPAYWLLTGLFNTFPLPRLRGFRRSFAHAGEAMDQGYSVMVFPEGHRSQSGEMEPFRPGIGLLAHDSQAPILPIGLVGLEEMRRRGRWFRSGRLTIRVGEPVAVDGTMEASEVTQCLEGAMRRLLASEISR